MMLLMNTYVMLMMKTLGDVVDEDLRDVDEDLRDVAGRRLLLHHLPGGLPSHPVVRVNFLQATRPAQDLLSLFG
jgi:hypothetical protein